MILEIEIAVIGIIGIALKVFQLIKEYGLVGEDEKQNI